MIEDVWTRKIWEFGSKQVLDKLDDPNVTIVDARSPQEYTGEVTYAEQAGHIPGAVNLVWLDALTGGDAVHTTEDDWREQLEDEDVERFQTATMAPGRSGATTLSCRW